MWTIKDDLADLPEAAQFYLEQHCLGKSRFQITKMLRVHFPDISHFVVIEIRRKALILLKEQIKNVEDGDFINESIVRLHKVMSMPGAKPKDILAADKQLTELLGLANRQSFVDAEDLAEKIIEFKKQASEVSAGETLPDEPLDTKEPSKDEPSPPDKQPDEQPKLSDEEIEQQLKIARLKRLKQDIKDAENKTTS